MFQAKPGYVLYQFLLWLVIVSMVLGNNQNRIIEALTFNSWPSNIVDIGFITFFIFIIYFINKFIAYETIKEIPSYLPNEFFELKTLIKKFIVNGSKNKWIWLKNAKSQSENIFISIYEYKVKKDLLPTLPTSPLRKIENSMDWNRLWEFIPFVKVLIFSFYAFTLFYAPKFIDEYGKSQDLSDFHTNFLLILWIAFYFFSGFLLIVKLKIEWKKTTILASFLLVLQLTYFNYSNLEESPAYYVTLLLFINTILYPYAFLIVMFIFNFKKIALSEYNLAVQRKNIVENFEILKDFIMRYPSTYDVSKERLKILLTNYNYSLKHEKHLRDFITKTNENNLISSDDFQKITKSYLIPVVKVKKARGEEILRRNEINLSFAKTFAKIFLGFYFLLRIFIGGYITSIHYFNYLDIILALAFSRLFIRSTEICMSFYKDLFDRPIAKKSLLNNKDRARLAINSLFEILIFSFITIFCIFSRSDTPSETNISLIDLIDLSFVKFFLMEFYRIFEVILYTISVSLFNVSFANFNEAPIYKLAPLKITHVIQVVSSLVLLTICLSSYINSNSLNRKIIIRKYFDKYYLIEENIYQKQERILIPDGYDKINDLKLIVLKMYQQNKISSDDFEVFMMTINSYILKNY